MLGRKIGMTALAVRLNVARSSVHRWRYLNVFPFVRYEQLPDSRFVVTLRDSELIRYALIRLGKLTYTPEQLETIERRFSGTPDELAAIKTFIETAEIGEFLTPEEREKLRQRKRGQPVRSRGWRRDRVIMPVKPKKPQSSDSMEPGTRKPYTFRDGRLSAKDKYFAVIQGLLVRERHTGNDEIIIRRCAMNPTLKKYVRLYEKEKGFQILHRRHNHRVSEIMSKMIKRDRDAVNAVKKRMRNERLED